MNFPPAFDPALFAQQQQQQHQHQHQQPQLPQQPQPQLLVDPTVDFQATLGLPQMPQQPFYGAPYGQMPPTNPAPLYGTPQGMPMGFPMAPAKIPAAMAPTAAGGGLMPAAGMQQQQQQQQQHQLQQQHHQQQLGLPAGAHRNPYAHTPYPQQGPIPPPSQPQPPNSATPPRHASPHTPQQPPTQSQHPMSVPNPMQTPQAQQAPHQTPRPVIQPPLSPASQSREKERVSTLLEINSALLQEVVNLQAQGKAGLPTPPQQKQGDDKDGETKPTQPPKREYIDCMRRLQANLAYLAAIADRSRKPSSAIPVCPAIMDAPPHLPGMAEPYARLQRLFPDAKPGVNTAQGPRVGMNPNMGGNPMIGQQKIHMQPQGQQIPPNMLQQQQMMGMPNIPNMPMAGMPQFG